MRLIEKNIMKRLFEPQPVKTCLIAIPLILAIGSNCRAGIINGSSESSGSETGIHSLNGLPTTFGTQKLDIPVESHESLQFLTPSLLDTSFRKPAAKRSMPVKRKQRVRQTQPNQPSQKPLVKRAAESRSIAFPLAVEPISGVQAFDTTAVTFPARVDTTFLTQSQCTFIDSNPTTLQSSTGELKLLDETKYIINNGSEFDGDFVQTACLILLGITAFAALFSFGWGR
jgi:hypothetical protein